MSKVERMQDNLEILRNSIGMSRVEFGKMIGISRQHVRNIETRSNKMSKAQYIAIRTFLNYTISKNEIGAGRFMIKLILEILIDNPGQFAITDVLFFKKYATMISRAISNKIITIDEGAAEMVSGLGLFMKEEEIATIAMKSLIWFEPDLD